MDVLRQQLVSKMEDVLSQLATYDDVPANSSLQIEATVVPPGDATTPASRILLDSIDIGQLRPRLGNHGDIATTPGSSPQTLHGTPSASAGIDDPSIPHRMIGNLLLQTSGDFVGTVRHVSRSPLHHGRASQQEVQGGKSPLTPPSTGDKHTCGTDGEQTSSKRQKQDKGSGKEQSAMDKFIEGIWEQIHDPDSLVIDADLTRSLNTMLDKLSIIDSEAVTTKTGFDSITRHCRQVTLENRKANKFLEVMIQAHWLKRYDERLAALKAQTSDLRAHEYKRIVLTEACTSFGWSEKELRNRMAIWKGYREIRDTAGWSALIFAGTGIYRFCKYRLGFDHDSITKLQDLRTRAEVAADTLQPQWRQFLSLIGESTDIRWPGHPHDWTVSLKSDQDPLPLATTYKQWDLNFSFENIRESRVDPSQWQDQDPRRFESGPTHHCKSCSLRQSSHPEENECECFLDLYGPKPRPSCPVQVFRTNNGKNNGLVACRPFDLGQAVGEFVGLITKGLADVDVMQSQAGDNEPYQIWQGRCGNFSRFMNHSCAPNCQFQTFSWMGVQRIVVVSKGIAAGQELTVDYSARYWDNLDKICLCGETCCRYRDRRKRTVIDDEEEEEDEEEVL